ncbi:hypothetical protein L6164_032196 [Bauhinia variegata]|uniref:Uncharacterized protein n=1 Tax=Bauhinia variegata TaxID=167791 RepID=A0ACB9KNN5_BAUVA|nr:hypothetical protein L6164_032196 [Bauhinia variegata]
MQLFIADNSSTNTKFPDKMAAPAPVAIGTRGTVGTLVRKEIEYFAKFELERRGNSQNLRSQIVGMVSRRDYSIPKSSFWVLLLTWRRKKRRGSSGFLPRICSVAEVAESNQFNRIPGYDYRILKNDMNNFQL